MRKIIIIVSVVILLTSCTENTSRTETANDSVKTETTVDSNLSPSVINKDGEEPQEDTSKTDYSYDNDVSSLGSGLILANEKFDLFNDSLLIEKFLTVHPFNGTNIETSIRPKFYSPDYGIIHFVCLDSNDKAYKVLINNSESKFIPKQNQSYTTWGNYIITSYGIIRRSMDKGGVFAKLPLRNEANDNADTIAIPQEHELFCPMEVKGDWVKVKYDCFYNDEQNEHEGTPCHEYIQLCTNPVAGWLKWREGNKVLIDIFLMP